MDDLEALVRAVVDGDVAAWQRLIELLVPRIEAIARSHGDLKRRGLAGSADDLAEVRTGTLERLSRQHYKNLARYLAQRAGGAEQQAQSFDSWLYGAVDFTVREHLRQRFGRAPKPSSESTSAPRPSKRDLGTNANRIDDEPLARAIVTTLGMTNKLTVAAIMAFIDQSFAPHEASAMRLYYGEGNSFAELAAALNLPDERSADKLIRRLNGRLRHKFASEADEGP
jgi:DNA-directed RNA polymerase specialized sigma24 family protein